MALHSAEQTQHAPLSGIRTHYFGNQGTSASIFRQQGHENRDVHGLSHCRLRPTFSDSLVKANVCHLECIDTDMILLIPRVEKYYVWIMEVSVVASLNIIKHGVLLLSTEEKVLFLSVFWASKNLQLEYARFSGSIYVILNKYLKYKYPCCIIFLYCQLYRVYGVWEIF